MTPFNAFILFSAIKQHFESKTFDATKYSFKVNSKPDSFLKRKDKYNFAKLAKHPDPKGFLIANFVEGTIKWSGDLNSDEADKVYAAWIKKQQSLGYTIESEIRSLEEDFLQSIKVYNGQHPILFRLYRQGSVSIETVIALNQNLNFFPYWDRKISDTILWPSFRDKCIKYQKILQYDQEKVKKLVLEVTNAYK